MPLARIERASRSKKGGLLEERFVLDVQCPVVDMGSGPDVVWWCRALVSTLKVKGGREYVSVSTYCLPGSYWKHALEILRDGGRARLGRSTQSTIIGCTGIEFRNCSSYL
jgi:hypothetical protein